MALPQRIIYPTDFFPLPDPTHQHLVEEFVEKLEGYLGVSKTEVSLAQLWKDKPPATASLKVGENEEESLQNYMKKVSKRTSAPVSFTHTYRGSD